MLEPARVNFEKDKIIDIAVGYNHCIALNA